MKVLDNRKHNTVFVDSLRPGDCFQFVDDSTLCMIVKNHGPDDDYCYYVDFEENEVNNTYHTTRVLPLTAVVTVS
jgi:hypothetical protein